MPKGTRKAIIDGLLALGWQVVPSRTSKYVTFQHADEEMLLYVGKSGALRKGRTISSSVSLTGFRWAKAVAEIGRQSESFSSTEQAESCFEAMLC